MITAIVFLVILSLLVLIHELGHFLVAKKLGIKVEEFGFGLPPKITGKKIGETEYSLNLLPIGGFVKLFGEDEAPRSGISLRETREKTGDKRRAFFARPVGQRASVVLAGVFMNALLAVAIFYAFLTISNFTTQLPLLGGHRFFLVSEHIATDIIVSAVAKDSPAQKAGITPLAKIVAVNGEAMHDSSFFLETINRERGRKVTIVWEELRSGKKFSATVVPRSQVPKNEGPLGIAFFSAQTATLSYESLWQKAFSGFIHPANLLVYNTKVLSVLVSASFREKSIAPVSQGVSGPVGIYSLVGNIVQIPNPRERLLQVLNLAGILSVSLAFFNLLPIPALDGGRLLFILIEVVTRRKVNPRYEGLAHAVGMAVLLALILFITLQDFAKMTLVR